jgi:putative ABC transport system permease protein
MNVRPPKWIDRLLTWYCNPDLLEEIQGDAYELYELRLNSEGATAANWKFFWDALRFCRWSNIKQQRNDFGPGFIEILLNLNFKIAWRTATKNKFTFFIKVAGLAICFAFTTVLIAFVVSEFTFDRHIKNYKSIYRIGSSVESHGTESNYAVSPLALAETLATECSEVELAARLMATHRPEIVIEDFRYYNVVTFSADSNFLKLLDFKILQGSADPLTLPDRIVLTESKAKTFFGDDMAIGKSLLFNGNEMEVAAVISNPSPRSHLKFDALISWSSFQHNEDWDNINAYTYVKIQNEVSREQFTKSLSTITNDYLELIISEYELKYKPIVQRVDEIHHSPPMDEDLAERGEVGNMYILLTVIVLFLATGIFNYLNITLAELTESVRKFTVLKIYGGITADGYKIATTDALLSLAAVVPLFILFIYLLLAAARTRFGIEFDDLVWTHPVVIIFLFGIPVVMIIASWINTLFISRSNDIAQSLKGHSKLSSGKFSLRQYLVGGQLSFSLVMIALMTVIVDQFDFIKDSDKGFSGHHVIVISPPEYDGENEAEVFMESLRSISGVDKVAGCSYLAGDHTETKEFFELESNNGMKKKLVNYINAGYDYMDMLGMRVTLGRLFEPGRETDAMGAYLVNETAARQFGWTNPIGKRINGPLDSDGREGKVIGVLKDFHYASLHNTIEPLIIFINKNWGTEFVYVKFNPLRSTNILSQIEDQYRKVFPGAPMNLDYLDSRYMDLYKDDNKIRNVFEVGLIVSLLLSSLGIFSISALLLVNRRREMGIRKIVGASRIQLFVMHMKTFLIFLVGATVISMPLIYLLSDQWLRGFAYHVDFSAWYLIFPIVVTLFIILFSTGVHAIKSSLINPIEILKQE